MRGSGSEILLRRVVYEDGGSEMLRMVVTEACGLSSSDSMLEKRGLAEKFKEHALLNEGVELVGQTGECSGQLAKRFDQLQFVRFRRCVGHERSGFSLWVFLNVDLEHS